jgi:AcrR family transcriptional regulator
MPRTRSDLDRDDKRQQILDRAEQQLRAGGFDGLSLAAIARELGVAQNTLYWYFPSKDELFVAVFRHVSERAAERRPPAGATPEEQAIWLFDELEAMGPIRLALHTRALSSPAVDALRAEGHTRLKALVKGWLPPTVRPSDRDLVAEAFLAAGEGLLLQHPPRPDRNRVVRFLLHQLTA